MINIIIINLTFYAENSKIQYGYVRKLDTLCIQFYFMKKIRICLHK
ncbi:hypothetical protein CNEO_500036 [Clostridium neonatale]|nr:hypothetical protein CNEO_500036 [Clostridium neonatale]